MQIASCIGCGCHDYHACADEVSGRPCSWLAVDYQAQLGVCSVCPSELSRWNAGYRGGDVPVKALIRFAALHDVHAEERAEGDVAVFCDCVIQDGLGRRASCEIEVVKTMVELRRALGY